MLKAGTRIGAWHNAAMSAPNVHPAEIAHFSALAARWWDEQGEMRTLHHINPVRLRHIETRLGPVKGLKVLDVGCGGGLLAEGLARRGAQVTGIDLSEAAIAVAEEHARASGLAIDYRCLPTEALAAEAPAAFDRVCCLEMLEHVPDPEAIVAACVRLLRPGGQVMFSTINRNPKAFLLAIVGAEQLLRLIPKGTHDYALFIKPSELSAWCRAVGLEVLGLHGLHYNPLLKSAHINEDVSVNYFLHARKPA